MLFSILLSLQVEGELGLIQAKASRVTSLINTDITSATMKPVLIKLMGHWGIYTGPQILLLLGTIPLLMQKPTPNNLYSYDLIERRKTRVFMYRLCGNVNFSILLRALKHFSWGGDHIIPYNTNYCTSYDNMHKYEKFPVISPVHVPCP